MTVLRKRLLDEADISTRHDLASHTGVSFSDEQHYVLPPFSCAYANSFPILLICLFHPRSLSYPVQLSRSRPAASFIHPQYIQRMPPFVFTRRVPPPFGLDKHGHATPPRALPAKKQCAKAPYSSHIRSVN